MHIPDGYLSPSTSIVMYAAVTPFWIRALQRVRGWVRGRRLPLVALFAAASFVVMMFNVPLPGGTTGHAVGAVLAAIVLGPWDAVLAISVALIIQALFFGDGGILAIGANCFNMAVVMPFVGYGLYRLIAGRSPVESPRRIAAAAIAAYVGLNVAAFLTAVEFGIQPLLFHTADGVPLYAPYGLDVAIPAMMGGHLLVAGPIEALVTGLVVAYLQRSHREVLDPAAQPTLDKRTLRPVYILWGVLGLLILLSPLGLLAAGTAWGEWGIDEIPGLGFVPAGMQRLADLWRAPIPDYAVPYLGEKVGYVVSALLGVGATVLALWLLGRVFEGLRPTKEKQEAIH
ncbi:MAG: cobalt transporter CbiM [Chloroflexia bacterium]